MMEYFVLFLLLHTMKKMYDLSNLHSWGRLVFLALFLNAFITVAYGSDSLSIGKASTLAFYKNQWLESSNPISNKLDTNLFGVQQYSPYFFGIQYAGNIGLAGQSLLFNPFRKSGWLSGQDYFDLVNTSQDEILYYNTKKRFTELDYVLGAKGEQALKIKHAQNVNPLWNIGFDLSKINTDGYLKRQATDVTDYDVHTWFHSPKMKYLVFASFLSNQVIVQENAGITSDNLFGKSNQISIELIPVNLSQAGNKLKNKSIQLTQIVNFGKEKQPSDSSKKSFFVPSQRFSHAISLDRASMVYSDNDPGAFYNQFYYNALSTVDSIHVDEMKNEFTWSMLGHSKDSSLANPFICNLLAEHRLVKYTQFDAAYLFHNFSGGMRLEGETKNVIWNAALNWQLLGDNKDEYVGSAEIKYKMDHAGFLGLRGHMQKRNPAFVFKQYFSNHFLWANQLEKVNIQNIHAFYVLPKYHLECTVDYFSVLNYAYLGTDALPQQLNQRINYYAFGFKKDFHWKKIHLNNQVYYQYNDHRTALSLPRFMNLHSFYYESRLFKKVLLAQLGFDLRFFGSWYADAYMPATRQFYRQTEAKIGGYPVFDLFFNFKIKSARLFLKVENVNEGFPFKNYYLLPHNPYPPRLFKFGISWRFFD